MTDIFNEVTSELAETERTVGQALKAFQVAIDVLESSVDELKADVKSGEKDLVQSLKHMNQAYLFAIGMKEKAREAGSEKFGHHGAGRLDLDAARAEIGVRLACLRAAGDS